MIHFDAQQIIGHRETQQDALSMLPVSADRKLFILADGMGGHQGGEIASQTVVKAFRDYFANPIPDELSADALYTALLRANAALRQLTLQHAQLQGMGTTVVAVMIAENGQFDYISVGDSPLYHQAASGSLKRINANHAFATELAQWVAAGQISAQDAAMHPQRHAITSALTGNEIAKIDRSSGYLNAGERLLLASDGVHTLADEQIAAILTQTPVTVAVSALLSTVEAQQQPYQDNTSVILLERTSTQQMASRTIDAPITMTLVSPNASIAETSVFAKKGLIVGFVLAVILGGIGVWLLTDSAETSVETTPTPVIPIQANFQHLNAINVLSAAVVVPAQVASHVAASEANHVVVASDVMVASSVQH